MLKGRTLGVFLGLMKRMDAKLKSHFWVLLFASVGAALAEMGALVLIALFASSLSNPETILGSSVYGELQSIWGGLDFDPQGIVLTLAVGVVLAALVKNFAACAFRYAGAKYSGTVSAFISSEVLSMTMRMPYPWTAGKNLADLMTQVGWGTASGLFVEQIVFLISDVFLLAILLFSLVLLDPVVVLLVLGVVGGLSLLLVSWIKDGIDVASEEGMLLRQAINRKLYVAIFGFRDIRIMGREKDFHADYAKDAFRLPFINARIRILQVLPGWILETLGFALLCGGTWGMLLWGGYSSSKVVGILTVIALAAWRGIPAVIRILNQLTGVRGQIPQLERVLSFLNEAEHSVVMDESFWEHGAQKLSFEELVEFKGVDFAYDDKIVLRDVNFTIRKGESVGVVGKSGAGKTTLVDMLIGLQRPSSGNILVDNVVIDESVRSSWLRQLGYVPQSPFIFDGTLAQNVAFCSVDDVIDRRQVEACCSRAAVDEFWDSLTDGMDSSLGDHGVRLSGGQQQRVCIARALYSEPEMVIFDEATSALDSKSERLIQDMIANLKGQVTMVIVAHRLATVETCDKIVWLENGQVRMVGKPMDVLAAYEAA